MTDVNASDYPSATTVAMSRFTDENNSSFILNESNIPMEVDFDDQIYTSNPSKINGHSSPTIEHNEQEKEDVFHSGNPILNKSFDVVPSTKKEHETSSTQPISDNSMKNTNVLDTTVELSNNSVDFDDIIPQDENNRETVNTQALLSNQFSLEYPYVIPQPAENIPLSSSPPNSVETVTNLTKTMKLNTTKSVEEPEPSTPASTSDKTFDTNTFVLKKKERRKMNTPATENSLNTTSEVTSPDRMNKQSPSTSLDTAVASRPATSQQQQPTPPPPLLMDPTRIM